MLRLCTMNCTLLRVRVCNSIPVYTPCHYIVHCIVLSVIMFVFHTNSTLLIFGRHTQKHIQTDVIIAETCIIVCETREVKCIRN